MHNNFFFISKLCPYLDRILKGFHVSECFSQEKDELLLRFTLEDDMFNIKATLKPHQTILSFPSQFHRARNNSIDLLGETIGEKVNHISCINNDRAIKIDLTNNKTLLFRLYGNQGNVILFQQNNHVTSFNQRIATDKEIILSLLGKDYLISEEIFLRNNGDIQKTVPTLGKIAESYWYKNYPNQDFSDLISYLDLLDKANQFFICVYNNQVLLSLFPIGQILHKSYNPIEACNIYYQTYIHDFQTNKEKDAAINHYRDLIKKSERYIAKSSERLHFLTQEARNEEYGHLIMANMHLIPPKITEITVEDFYHSNSPVCIPLKKELNAQQNAEYYYKKAKNEWREIDKIKENIQAKKDKIIGFEQTIEQLNASENVKQIRTLLKPSSSDAKQSNTEELFRKVIIENYTVYIGKNSANNDLLTLKYATKEDIWLHARNVSGSHVVIKNIPGQKTPKWVIERAAEIAAYHSKAKNETLTPVMFTFKKFVRKIKGSAPGSVVVDKEEVIIVQPKDY